MKKFLSCESGITTIEYGLIAAVIVLVIVGALAILGDGTGALWGDVETEVTTNTAP